MGVAFFDERPPHTARPALSQVLSLLHKDSVCILAFRERAVETSQTFASSSSVLACFEAAGCSILHQGEFGVDENDAPESVGLLTGMWEIRRGD